MSLDLPVVIAIAVVAVSVVAFLFLRKKSSPEEEPIAPTPDASKDKKSKANQPKVDITAKFKQENSTKAKGKAEPEHPLLAFVLKGHQGTVKHVTFSAKGRVLLSCSEDQTLRLWFPKTFAVGKEPVSSRIVTKFDHATVAAISADEQVVAAGLYDRRQLAIFDLSANKDKATAAKSPVVAEERVLFPTPHKIPIECLSLDPHNKSCVITSVGETDTHIPIFNLKGEPLHTINTNQIMNHQTKISPDGKFLIAATRMSEVRIWELVKDKAGQFARVEQAMTLKGHTKGAASVDFSRDSKSVVVASHDGQWRLWSLEVRYAMSEDPKLKLTAKTPFESCDLIALGGKEEKTQPTLVAVTHANTIALFSIRGELVETIENAHHGKITALSFSPDGLTFATCASGEKIIKVWNVPPAFR